MMEVKPEAKILDATASYRSMWKAKQNDGVLWIDIEPEIDLKPDLIMDCSNTDFPDNRFHTIFFDPPHSYGHTKNTGVHQTPSRKVQKEKWGNTGAYYGFDQYPTKRTLLAFINKSQLEFQRILQDGGILWVKWGELFTTWSAMTPFFRDWVEVMKFEVIYQGKQKGCRTWWIALMKKPTIKTKQKRT